MLRTRELLQSHVDVGIFRFDFLDHGVELRHHFGNGLFRIETDIDLRFRHIGDQIDGCAGFQYSYLDSRFAPQAGEKRVHLVGHPTVHVRESNQNLGELVGRVDPGRVPSRVGRFALDDHLEPYVTSRDLNDIAPPIGVEIPIGLDQLALMVDDMGEHMILSALTGNKGMDQISSKRDAGIEDRFGCHEHRGDATFLIGGAPSIELVPPDLTFVRIDGPAVEVSHRDRIVMSHDPQLRLS